MAICNRSIDYSEFLMRKGRIVPSEGMSVNDTDINPMLFPFQRDLTRFALRKGRAAIFADTGLGKTLMQSEWARLVGKRTLILAPLTVARQTVREATNLGMSIQYVRSQNEVDGHAARAVGFLEGYMTCMGLDMTAGGGNDAATPQDDS